MADSRRRMIVEEVSPDSNESSAVLEEVKEKVEELHEITQDLNEDVAKTEEIQEEIAEAVDSASLTESENEAVSETETETETEVEHYHQSHEHPEHHAEHMDPPIAPPDMHVHDHSSFMDEGPAITNPNSTNPLVVIIPGIFLLGALLGGIYFYQKGTNSSPTESPMPTATDITAPTSSPSAAPVSTVDVSKYPVNILNGSGIAGEAGKVKTILESGGFKVSGTGNASSYNFTKTVIKTKADVPAAFVTKLTELLGKTYTLDTAQTLPASSSDQVQVVVGSTKK